jgi:hypothetical protein
MKGMAQSRRRGQDVEQWLWLWREEDVEEENGWMQETERAAAAHVLLLPLLPAPVHDKMD